MINYGIVAKELKKKWKQDEIESSILAYILKAYEIPYEDTANELRDILVKENSEIFSILKENGLDKNITDVIDLFEALLEIDSKTENGIVFTPKYITNYIVKNTFENTVNNNIEEFKCIDPGCGCGIFLISIIEYILNNSNKDLKSIIEEQIFGIDIEPDNARRCRYVLQLYAAINGVKGDVKVNILCGDTLKIDWFEEFNISSFDIICGNPPYVNTHDMNKETIKFLKETFKSTTSGVFNIFYAFIEKSLKFISKNGQIGFIVPNNFLTIKSAENLRILLSNGKHLKKIIDFGSNMIFRPVRTYNCILFLNNNQNDNVIYSSLDAVEDIETSIERLEWNEVKSITLDKSGWKLLDKKTLENLRKIEGQMQQIREFIRTGIATLKDEVFMVNKDEIGYFKNINGERYDVEPDLIKNLYKIPELKKGTNLEEVRRYIIFPYKKTINGAQILPEDEFKDNYPKTYQYLLSRKDELNSRDKGKPNSVTWYAYGRTQGLNRYGKKTYVSNVFKYTKISNG